MNESLHKAWQRFEKTGKIDAYLEFRNQINKEFMFEAGEDFELNKNIGDCDKGDEIR